ncbi:MAG: NGG1p interacting factor NIF3, partial [Gammaproteobacteria bacterium]|nr:NGG1p interacting factor NIF3 [Gammaproteobacteria bacterium]
FDGYSECAWQTLGQGQFRPLPGSQPFIGTMNTLEKVAEYKVEMVCPLDRVREVISALKAAHPYETPAFELYEVQME